MSAGSISNVYCYAFLEATKVTVIRLTPQPKREAQVSFCLCPS